jgi:hypothetical protein
MQISIKYNNRTYRKHPKQKYYYTSRKGNNYSRSLHRQMWFDNHGEIPEGFQVHHKDGNAFNNTIENLEIINKGEHSKYHSDIRVKENPERFKKLAEIGREYAKQWHGSKEGKEWHRQNAINTGFGNIKYGFKNCKHCNKEFEALSSRVLFCHNNCKSAWRRANNPDKIKCNCEKCGEEFIGDKYSPRRFCSIKCKPIPNPHGNKGKRVLF